MAGWDVYGIHHQFTKVHKILGNKKRKIKNPPTINHLSWYFPQSIMIFYITRRKLNGKYKDCWEITMEITMAMTMQTSGYAYSKLAY